MNARVDTFRAAERALWASLGAEPRELFLDLPRPRIRVRLQEIGSGPPVLLLHGVMTAGTSFAPLVARMAHARCLILDRPGCGLSEPWQLGGTMFRSEAVEVISSILDAMGLEQVSLVGNSLGCLWAFWFTLSQPSRVNRVVQLGASAGMPGVQVPVSLRLLSLPALGDVMGRMQRPSVNSVRRSLRSMGHGPSIERGEITNAFLNWAMNLMANTPTMANDRQILKRAVGLRGMQSWALLTEEELRSIVSPALILSGDADSHGGPVVAKRVALLVPGAKVEILPGAGHLPWLDDPEHVAQAALSFLAQ